MKITGSRGAKALALVALVSAVGACGLPRSGPNKAEIFKGLGPETGRRLYRDGQFPRDPRNGGDARVGV